MKSKHPLPPWLKPRSPRKSSCLGVCWYTEDEWAKVKATAVDAERFDSNFLAWLQVANKSLADLHAAGIRAEKYLVSADTLLAWCLVHNKRNDASARAEYVSDQLGSAK